MPPPELHHPGQRLMASTQVSCQACWVCHICDRVHTASEVLEVHNYSHIFQAWWSGESPPKQSFERQLADRHSPEWGSDVAAGSAAVEAAHRGPLQLKNVEFTYPLRKDRPVLQNLNLTIPRGQVTALVGRRQALTLLHGI